MPLARTPIARLPIAGGVQSGGSVTIVALAGRATSWSHVLGAAFTGVPLAGHAEGGSRELPNPLFVERSLFRD